MTTIFTLTKHSTLYTHEEECGMQRHMTKKEKQRDETKSPRDRIKQRVHKYETRKGQKTRYTNYNKNSSVKLPISNVPL